MLRNNEQGGPGTDTSLNIAFAMRLCSPLVGPHRVAYMRLFYACYFLIPRSKGVIGTPPSGVSLESPFPTPLTGGG